MGGGLRAIALDLDGSLVEDDAGDEGFDVKVAELHRALGARCPEEDG